MMRALCLTALLTLFCGQVEAHSELPTAQWCEAGTPVEVASFRFSPSALLRPADGGDSCPVGSDASAPLAKNCGQFDDDYKHALGTCQHYCDGFRRVRGRDEIADAGSVIPLVSAPASFLSETHHRDYTLNQGLSGICVRCEARSIAPPAATNSASGSSR